MKKFCIAPAAAARAHAFGAVLPAGATLIEVPVAFGKARAVYWPPRGHVDCHVDHTVFAQRLPAWLDAHLVIVRSHASQPSSVVAKSSIATM